MSQTRLVLSANSSHSDLIKLETSCLKVLIKRKKKVVWSYERSENERSYDFYKSKVNIKWKKKESRDINRLIYSTRGAVEPRNQHKATLCFSLANYCRRFHELRILYNPRSKPAIKTEPISNTLSGSYSSCQHSFKIITWTSITSKPTQTVASTLITLYKQVYSSI